MTTTFWVVAIAMTVAVVVLLAVPLARRRGGSPADVEQDRSNVALYHDQLHELERDRDQGVISAEQFEQARLELSQRLLADVGPGGTESQAVPVRSGTPWRYAVLAFVPIASVLGYLALGMPEAVDPAVTRAAPTSPADHAQGLEQLAQRLADRLQQNPDDTEAWVLLARSYQMLGKAPEAVKAFARAIQLLPNSAQLYADYADVQVGASRGEWTPGARDAVKRALEIDPAHPKAVWLAGTEAHARKDYAASLAYWERLLPLVQQDAEAVQVVSNNIAETRSLLGLSPGVPAAQPTAGKPTADAATTTAKAPGAETLKGTVSIDAKLKGDVRATDAVFVFARAAEGPKMPLAIRRVTVQELPYTFSLDDAAAMAPGMAISKFDRIVVGARVSRSGDAAPKPGDLEGYSAPVKPGAAGIEVRIDTRVQ